MTQTMRALKAYGKHQYRLEEVPVPELRDRMQDNVRVGRERMM